MQACKSKCIKFQSLFPKAKEAALFALYMFQYTDKKMHNAEVFKLSGCPNSKMSNPVMEQAHIVRKHYFKCLFVQSFV